VCSRPESGPYFRFAASDKAGVFLRSECMKGEDMRRRRLCAVVLFLAVGISLAACGVAKGAALSGYVYAGEMSRDDTPLAGVTVELYCSNDADSLGTLTASTKTSSVGWYSLNISGTSEFYNIVQKDLPGSTSVGATSVGGRVIGPNRIQYESPLERKVLTGNNFWDNVPEKDLCDLIIADIWFGQGNVCYMIRNIGRAAAPKGHLTKLSIDGQEKASDLITVPLAVGEVDGFEHFCAGLDAELLAEPAIEGAHYQLSQQDGGLFLLYDPENVHFLPHVFFGERIVAPLAQFDTHGVRFDLLDCLLDVLYALLRDVSRADKIDGLVVKCYVRDSLGQFVGFGHSAFL